MKEELKPRRIALSLAIVVGIISIVCALLIAVSPQLTMNLFGSIFHGIDVSQIASTISWGSALLGTLVAIALAYVTGWLFAVVYNSLK